MSFIQDYWSTSILDPRTRKYYLMNSGPTSVSTILAIYLLFAKWIGPSLMKSRPAFHLRHSMTIYNITMVILNGYFFFQSLRDSNYGLRLLTENEVPPLDYTPETLAKIDTLYFYWLTKFLDLIDTVFFVLRKKKSHITFLHLYHHSIVPILGLLAAVIPSAAGIYIFVIANSFVHTIMYSYYALSAMGDKVTRHLWWKKYLTQLQIGQFILYIIYGSILSLVQKGYPPIVLWFVLIQAPFFFYMFSMFYIKRYREYCVLKKSSLSHVHTSPKYSLSSFEKGGKGKERDSPISSQIFADGISRRC